MFENMTAQYLIDRLLSNVDDRLDKREGSVIYDALMPCAIELENNYHQLDMVLEEAFADSASMEYLIRRAAERGLLPRSATYAHMKAAFYGAEIPIGNRYNCGLYNYQVEKKLDEALEGGAYYEVICETPGSAPNTNLGILYPVSTDDYVNGMQSAELCDVIVPGEDDEDQELFRERYFASFESASFGGNIADYKERVNALDGVGGVKVFPVWNGPGTVKLVIITSTYEAPNPEFVKDIQDQIDPGLAGIGEGIAPIGHKVTVEGVESFEISVSADFTCTEGATFESVKSDMEEVLDQYFEELARSWENSTRLVVRTSRIEVRLLDVDGILDIQNLTVNGATGNIELTETQIPKRGELTNAG